LHYSGLQYCMVLHVTNFRRKLFFPSSGEISYNSEHYPVIGCHEHIKFQKVFGRSDFPICAGPQVVILYLSLTIHIKFVIRSIFLLTRNSRVGPQSSKQDCVLRRIWSQQVVAIFSAVHARQLLHLIGAAGSLNIL